MTEFSVIFELTLTAMVLFRRAFFLVLILTGCNLVSAQRLNTGFSMEIYGFHPTKFPEDLFFSNTSYKAYYIEKWQTPKAFTFVVGINLVADYSRFFVSTKLNLVQAGTNGIIYKYSYPIAENQFKDYYSRIGYAQTELLGSFGYFLNTQKYFKPYIELGLGQNFPLLYTEEVSTDPDFDTYTSNQYELRDYMELDKQYTFLMVGFGYRGDILAVTSRYNIRLGNQDVYYSTFFLGIAAYTKFSKLRKHYIYQPSE